MGAVGGRSGGRARGSGGDVLAGGGRAEGRDRAGQREGAIVECDRPELRMPGAREQERKRARCARLPTKVRGSAMRNTRARRGGAVAPKQPGPRAGGKRRWLEATG